MEEILLGAVVIFFAVTFVLGLIGKISRNSKKIDEIKKKV